MSELNASNLRKEHGNEGPDLVGVTELTSPYYMVPPSGTTAERPQNPQKGTLRFNTDIGSLEYFKGDTIGWESIDRVSSAPIGGRGLVLGGNPGGHNTIGYVTIATTGNAADYGDLTVGVAVGGASGSTTRAVIGGGSQSPNTNTIGYGEFATLGNFSDFGDLTAERHWVQSGNDKTRGLFIGGHGSPSLLNTIDYITYTSTGNAQDFGDITNGETTVTGNGPWGNSTRALFGGGTPNPTNVIEYVIVQSAGNGVDFGDFVRNSCRTARCADSVRAIAAGGQNDPGSTRYNSIEYVTTSTLGNTSDFGDLTQARGDFTAFADSTRGVFGGGNAPSSVNTIDYITIATTGNAIDFGDNTITVDHCAGCSNMNGGVL